MIISLLAVFEFAGENDLRFMLSETSAKTCEAGADAATSVHSRTGESDLKHKMSETGTKACEAHAGVGDLVAKRLVPPVPPAQSRSRKKKKAKKKGKKDDDDVLLDMAMNTASDSRDEGALAVCR